MRAAGTIPKQREARRFADFLLTQGIAARLQRSCAGWTVWVVEEELVARVRTELEGFLREPGAARFAMSREAERIRAEAREAQLRRARAGKETEWGRSLARALASTPLTWALLVFTGVVALATGAADPGSPQVARLMIAAPGSEGLAELAAGEVWRLVTPIFLHAGPLDLLFAALMLSGPGRRVEATSGTAALAGLVLAFAVVGTVAQYMSFGPCPIGLSGTVLGLLGFAAVMARLAPRSGHRVLQAEVATVAAWLGACLLGLVGPVAVVAVVAGLVCGLGVGAAAGGLRRPRT